MTEASYHWLADTTRSPEEWPIVAWTGSSAPSPWREVERPFFDAYR
ncbi:hypothetical protein ACH4M4_23000 [Streptomyces sp. NPDC017254]